MYLNGKRTLNMHLKTKMKFISDCSYFIPKIDIFVKNLKSPVFQ